MSTRACPTSRASTRSATPTAGSAFDIEVIFIYLWAIVFRSLLLGGFVSMLLFVGILLLGLAYAWRKGVLTWR